MVILETVCAMVNKTLCCTRLEKPAEDSFVDIKIEKIQESEDKNFNDQTVSDSDTIVKLIIQEKKKNAPMIKSCTCRQECERELNKNSSETKPHNTVSTNSWGGNRKTFAEQYKCQQQQNTEKEWQITIVPNKHCSGSLSNDEPHKYDVSTGIDIQDPLKVTCCKAESTRMCAQQLPVTSSGNCNCRTCNLSTSTSYMSYYKEKIKDKKNKNRICPLTIKTDEHTSKPSSFIKFLRRCFHRNK